jgi:membrane protein DedA with SNARE-associated domain
VSPSKKANKEVSAQKTKSALRNKKTSVRSSRVKPAAKIPKAERQALSATRETALVMPAQNQGIESPVIEAKKKSSLTTNILRVLALLAVIGITYFVFSIRDRVGEFEAYGYPGIFLIALMANATVLLPAPGVAIIYAMGSVFNPFLVGIAAGTGGALGELSGYLAGFSGQAVIERANVYDRIKPWVDKYGGWAILVLSAIPNPFFDVAGIAAGISKMKMRTFLLSTWGGQLIKMTLFALAGRYSIDWITKLIG